MKRHTRRGGYLKMLSASGHQMLIFMWESDHFPEIVAKKGGEHQKQKVEKKLDLNVRACV